MLERIQHLDHAVRAMSAESAEVLRGVASLDDPNVWERDGATSMTSWLAARYGLAWGTAREWVRVSRALQDLPAIAGAYAKGRISWDQLRPLTRFATPETDEDWAREAPTRSCAFLYREARRHERVRAKDEEETHRYRFLALTWNEERTELYLDGMLGAEQGVALERAVASRSETVILADKPYDPAGARRADALVELVSEVDGEQAPVTLVVHAEASVLSGESGS